MIILVRDAEFAVKFLVPTPRYHEEIIIRIMNYMIETSLTIVMFERSSKITARYREIKNIKIERGGSR